MRSLDISIAGQTYRLLAGGGLYLPQHRMLLVADLHLGKEATFRRHGIPVPSGTTTTTLRRVSDMRNQCDVRTLVVLGDLVHARSSLQPPIQAAFSAFLNEMEGVEFVLVEGNHDRSSRTLLSDLGVQTIVDSIELDGCRLIHAAEDAGKSSLTICGHLHPAIRLPHHPELGGKWACFWLAKKRLVLPAVGDFTGTATIKPNTNDRIWITAEQELIEVSSLFPRSRQIRGSR